MADLYDFPNLTSGVDQGLIDISTEIPAFPVMLLLFVFGVIFIGGMTTQARRTGYADAPMWSTIGFLTIDLMALLMSVTAGVLNPIILSALFGLTMFSGLWLFLSRGRFESN